MINKNTFNNNKDKSKRIIDTKALTIYIKLVEMKMIYVNQLSILIEKENLSDKLNTIDIGYLSKNISIIDKKCKNLIFKLRLRAADSECIFISNNSS